MRGARKLEVDDGEFRPLAFGFAFNHHLSETRVSSRNKGQPLFALFLEFPLPLKPKVPLDVE